jgi:predicted site-specific integrase-resolvase
LKSTVGGGTAVEKLLSGGKIKQVAIYVRVSSNTQKTIWKDN